MTECTYRPLRDTVVIVAEKLPKITQAGLSLPDETVEAHHCPIGKVVAVGPECKWVKVGDRVLVPIGTMITTIRHCNQVTRLVLEEQIAGIIEKEI